MENEVTQIITAAVYAVTGVSVEQMQLGSQRDHIVDARRITAMMMLAHMKGVSLATIGLVIGRDHSTISSYRDTHREWIETNVDYRNKVERVELEIVRLLSARGVETLNDLQLICEKDRLDELIETYKNTRRKVVDVLRGRGVKI